VSRHAPGVNVLFLTHAFPRALEDAAGSFVLRLAAAVRAEGAAVTVVAPHAPGLAKRDMLGGVPVRRFRYAPERYETLAYVGTMAEQVRGAWTARLALAGLVAGAIRSVARVGREVRPQLVHAHWWFPSGLAAVGASLVRRLPVVTTLHGSDVRLASGVIGARTLYARVAARSSIVTAVSTWLASQASALSPDVPPPRVAPMPVDVRLFSPNGTRSPNRLLFVGRLTAQKGVDMLLRALADIPRDVSLDIVGDGAEAEALRRLTASLELEPRVRWHPPVPQSTLVEFYRTATALIVPSVDEGLGLVAVEAHLCETPVVAFDSGGLRDVVVDGETGIVARSITGPALASAISELLRRSDRGAALGRQGRVCALENFAPEAVGRRYVDLYREAIAHFNRRQS
jgi:glycosyltransferase involved in cell wall biosynthesis